MSLEIGFASQTPSLPTGGGSVGGLGETFAPDLSTGSGTFTVPLDLPNGPNDVGPRLMLRYDTGNPNGPFGLGWTLPLPRILRSTGHGRPRYDDSDQLVLEGSGPLVRSGDGWEPEVSTGDWRIEQQGDGWLVTDRAGTRYRLGITDQARIEGTPGAPWAWLLEQIEDNLGSTVEFAWRAAGSQRYLESIAYGVYRIELAYEPRPDRLRWARGGFLLQTDERCARIELHLTSDQPSLVRRWDLAYTQAEPNDASLLAGVVLTGAGRDGAELTAPGLTLSYAAPGPPRLVAIPAQDDGAAPPLMDGGGRVELVDWDGDGVADVVEFGNGGETRIWPNRGGSWGRPVRAEPVPQLAGATARAGLIDFDGDGLADAVRIDQPLAGFQPRTADGFGRPVSWTRAPAVTLASNACRLADLDGDGAADLMWSAGDSLLLAHRRDPDGWDERPLVVPATPSGPPTDLTDPHVHCADMTGDGTPDLVRVDGGGTTYWPYLGYGRFGEPVRMPGAPVLGFDTDPTRVFVVDLDGDGCADVLVLDDRAGMLRWWPNCMGEHFGQPRTVAHLPTGAMRELRVADVLGTGRPALCWSVPRPSGRAAWFALDLLGEQTPGLLTRIDNGVGLETAIAYTTSAAERERDRGDGHVWPQTLPLVLPLVASTTVHDRATAREETTAYRYHDGRYDGRRREFAGFGRVEQRDPGDEHVATLITTRWFHTGLDADGQEPLGDAERSRRRALRGRLLRQDRADDAGTVLDRLEQAWEAVDGDVPGVVRPRLRSSTSSRIEGGDEPASWIVTETLDWDADGNATEQVEQSWLAGGQAATATLRTHTQYAHDPAGRYRQRVCRVRQDDGAGASLADSITFYDDLPLGAVGAQGLVTSRIALALTDEAAEDVYGEQPPDLRPAGYVRRAEAPGWWIELGSYHREQDADGLHGTVTGLRGATSTIAFDPTGCYPARVTDAMGNTASAEFDPRAYQPTSFTAPGGAASAAHFDALARLTSVVEPGDSDQEPTVAYSYRSNVVPTEVTVRRRGTPDGPPIEQRQFLDGSGNLLERRGRDEAGEVSEVTTAYGARGLPVGHWLPQRADGEAYAPPDPARPHAELAYDPLGRPVRTVRPDGARHTVRYLPGMIEEADEEDLREQAPAPHAGSLTRRYLDAAGRAVRVEQQLGGRVLTTSYRYDLRGNVIEHIDAAGRATRFVHDLMGRPLRVERPEAVHVNIVDPAGNPVETRSGEHRVLRSFDPVNRLLEVRHDDPGGDPVVACTYHDDGSPVPTDAGDHTAGGRLVRVQDEAGVTVFDYDERGRMARKRMTPEGGDELEVLLGHRPDGLIDSVTYPAADGGQAIVARYAYDRRGRLVSLAGVIDEIGYDDAGLATTTRYANGTVRHDEYDPLTSWLARSRLEGPGGDLRDISYGHDLVGNLVSVTSPDAQLSWTYTYDDLYRLVDAARGSGETFQYAYNDAGDLASTSQLGAFTYGQSGAAATCLTRAGGDRFGYDERGLATSAPWGTHSYDAEGRLRRIERGDGTRSELTYGHNGTLVRRDQFDANGDRSSRVDSPDQLVWIEDGELVLQLSDGERIVARQRADGSRSWLHHDHLGSLVLVTDEAGEVTLSLTYDPYGQVLERNGAAVVRDGFGAGEPVTAELILLGARWYCPRIGRFLTPDPVVGGIDDPLAWNAYLYCRDNPVSLVDPTGRWSWRVFGMVMAAIAIIALVVIVSVFTFGIGTPGAVAIGSVTWGAIFTATMVGIAAGGVIGGIAAARAGGDAGDIVLGALVGAAVGGWAAFGAAFAGPAAAGLFGLHSGVAAGAVAGGVSGAINGAAMGFAAGFAGGRNNGFKDVMEKVLVGAIVGAAIGTALGALSGMTPPKGENARDSVGKVFKAETPTGPGGNLPPSGQPTTPGGLPGDPSLHSLGDAAGKTGLGMASKIGGAVLPHVAASTAGFTGSYLVQTVAVDLSSAAASGFWDDIKQYVRTHVVNVGPIGS